jgi:hypothetical protein
MSQMPEQIEKNCPYIQVCPVYKLWRLFAQSGGTTLWDVIRQLDQDRAKELAQRIEWQEPQRSTIDALTKENAALRSYKRRAELFLLSKGLSLPDD